MARPRRSTVKVDRSKYLCSTAPVELKLDRYKPGNISDITDRIHPVHAGKHDPCPLA